MRYKCIIFDCDGILVDSEGITNAVLIQMVGELGVEIDRKHADDNLTGKSLKACFEHLEKLLDGSLPSTFEKEYRDKTFAAFQTDMKPIKGISEVLEQITVPFCVASNGPREKIELNLRTTKLIDRFEGNIFSAYDIGSWKPKPELFEHAAKTMGFKPADCAVIEDSLAGVVAGVKGGFDVYGFANEKNKEAFKNEGAQVFFRMDDLYKLLK